MAILNRIFGHEGIKEALRGCKSIQADKAQKEYIENQRIAGSDPRVLLQTFLLQTKKEV